jgi:hypothetical protein
MKYTLGMITGLTLAIALTGCMKDEEPEDAIPEGYKKSMEKAENVEQTLQQSAEDRLKSLDEGD